MITLSCGTDDSGYNSNLSISINSTQTSFSDHSLSHCSTLISPKINLEGRKFVDFMYHLGDRNDFQPIVKKILSYLIDEDLYNAAAVSKIWRQVINRVPPEEKRLKAYKKMMLFTKENRFLTGRDESWCPSSDEVRLPVVHTPRLKLMQIQNIQDNSQSSISSGSSSPSSGRTSFRFEAYQAEARKLKLGQQLYSCPKCKLPSHADPKTPNTAECTNTGCRYRFCILCQCGEHLYKFCNFISTPVPRKQTTKLCTTKSKKNLKRLLL